MAKEFGKLFSGEAIGDIGLVRRASFHAFATIGVEFHKVPSISRIKLSGFIGVFPFFYKFFLILLEMGGKIKVLW